jgi:GT2 family glycosyltransferase
LTLAKSSNNCDVVIVNYNAGALLFDCVSSVVDEDAQRIIVVDNGSLDGSIDALAQINLKHAELTVIRNDSNLGFAKASNIGAALSSADQILFLNPDSTLTKGALKALMSTLNSSPDIGMVGGFLSNPDGSEQPGGRRVFPTPKRAFMRAFGLSRFAKSFPEVFSDFLLHNEALPNTPIAVEAISGACMLAKREAIEDVGLWDENYFLHCEDLDWCMRMIRKGWKIMFVPDAKVVHIWGACSRKNPVFVEWHKHKGMIRFYRKYFRYEYPGVLWGLVILGVWIRFSLVTSYFSVRRIFAAIGFGRD